MEPTEIESSGFNNLGDIAEWVGLAHRPSGGTDEDSPRGTLFALMGATPSTHWRVLAAVMASDWTTLLDQWRVSTQAPTMAQRSQGGLLAQAARITAGMQKRQEAIAEDARRNQELALEQAKATQALAALPSLPKSPPQPASAPGRKVKLSTVADQANDHEAESLSDIDVAAAYERYKKLTGGPPAPHEELTHSQLTALSALLGGQGPPYVDFSVWGPFGHRIQKKVKLTGLSLNSAGELHPLELFGPSDFESWDACYRVWRTGMLMLGAASLSTLESYREQVALYSRRYGRDSWVVIYQADVRARLEHLERMRRAGEARHRALTAAPGTPVAGGDDRIFDPAMPWDWSLRALVGDTAFWRRELEEPALLVLARAARLSAVVEGDAPVERPAAPQGAHTKAPRATPRERPQKAQRMHHVNTEGTEMTTNRGGYPLCSDFQVGKCQPTRGNLICPVNPAARHQCAKCLSPAHGSSTCNAQLARAPKGAGKGKGKQGRGGRRPQY